MLTRTSGGIHLPNLPQLLHASTAPISDHALDGVAVISDIVSSTTPKRAAQELRTVIDSFKSARRVKGNSMALFASRPDVRGWAERTPAELIKGVKDLLEVVRGQTPMIHQVSLCHSQMTES